MKRRLLNLLTALSLLMFVAVCVLWVRSYWVSQFVGWSDASRFVGVLSMGGLVRLEHATYPAESRGWSRVFYPTPGGPGLWGEARARDHHGGSGRASRRSRTYPPKSAVAPRRNAQSVHITGNSHCG